MADEQKQPATPKTQTFNLKDVETQTLMILQSSHQRSFAATLSLLAQERMGYRVTEQTQFKLNPEMTEIEISELPADVPVASAPAEGNDTPPAAPGKASGGAVTA